MLENPNIFVSQNHKGFVDHFYDFWIQTFVGPFSRFLDPEIAVILWLLDPEISPFLQFLDSRNILVHFQDYWIQKLQYFYIFWVQKLHHFHEFLIVIQ